MKLELLSLPQVAFTHVFGAEEYHNVLRECAGVIEITYVADGVLQITRNGEVYHAATGDLICNTYTGDMKVDADAYHSHHTVGFWVDYRRVEGDEDLAHLELPAVLRGGQGTEPIRKIIDDIIRTNTLYPEDRLLCAGLFLQLLNLISNEYRHSRETTMAGEYRYVRKAKRYIFDHITESIRQMDVAAHLDISPEYLCTLFKRSEGCSVIHFVNRLKLNKIRTLMEKDRLSLREASLMYGYTDPNYVSRLYKKYYHVSITESLQDMEKGRL